MQKSGAQSKRSDRRRFLSTTIAFQGDYRLPRLASPEADNSRVRLISLTGSRRLHRSLKMLRMASGSWRSP